MDCRISFQVYGKVQGVFFRVFTRGSALKHNLTGWVQNSAQGTVIGEAQGKPEDIGSFKADLELGPELAKVDKVDIKDIPIRTGETGFEKRKNNPRY